MNQMISHTDFQGLSLDIIDHNGQRWLTAEQVGLALGYAKTNARDGAVKLFNRHKDEFTAQDSTMVKLTAVDNKQRDVRIFSQSGCNLLSFFANTQRAKQFRAWAKQALVAVQQPVVQSGEPMERMAVGIEKLAQGMDVMMQQLDHTKKYIAMVERNQRGHIKITHEVAKQIELLKAQGMSQASIARELRVSPTSVNLIIKSKYVFSELAGVPTQLEQEIEQERADLVKKGLLN